MFASIIVAIQFLVAYRGRGAYGMLGRRFALTTVQIQRRCRADCSTNELARQPLLYALYDSTNRTSTYE